MSYKQLFFFFIMTVISFSCSSPNESDDQLILPAGTTPVVTGIFITRSMGSDVVGVWGNPSDHSVTASSGSIPRLVSFENPYPNPCINSCNFYFTIPKATIVNLWIMRARWINDKRSDVINIGGAMVVTTQHIAEIKLIRNETMSAGHYSLMWDGRNQNGDQSPGGFYRVYFKAGDDTYWHDIFLFRENQTNLPAGLEQYLQFY